MWYSKTTFNEWYENEKGKIKNGFEETELIGRSDFLTTFSGKITKFEPSTDSYSCWDLRVERTDGELYTIEVKKRNYPLNYFMEHGVYLELSKYDKLQKEWVRLGTTFQYVFAIKTSDKYWILFNLSARFSNVVGIAYANYCGHKITVDTNSPIVYKQVIQLKYDEKFDRIYNERGEEVCY